MFTLSLKMRGLVGEGKKSTMCQMVPKGLNHILTPHHKQLEPSPLFFFAIYNLTLFSDFQATQHKFKGMEFFSPIFQVSDNLENLNCHYRFFPPLFSSDTMTLQIAAEQYL